MGYSSTTPRRSGAIREAVRMRTPTALLVAVLIPVCHLRGQSVNGTCPPRDTVYASTPADSGRDFKVASPALIRTPPPDFHGGADVHMLITADGRVVGDSTRVLGASAQDSAVLARAVRSYRFHPATIRGCSIATWYAMKFRR